MDWRAALLTWYDRHRRNLPWRGTRDPWAVLVSEVMLQQTRVETAAERYAPFLQRFPTPAAMARAPESQVLAAWAGLGYYRRARNLHRAARTLAGRPFPSRAAEWEDLPGVGPYTARAVAAIAQGERVLAVDGNVDRVLSRLLASTERSVARRRGALAREVVPPPRAGDFLQALFDLGATVCTPRRPDCSACPLAAACAGRANPARHPPRPARRPPSPPVHVAAALHEGPRVRLVRTEGEFLGGLWALPHATGPTPAEARRALHAIVRTNARPVATYRHVFSHRRWEVRVYRAQGAPRAGRWWPRDALPPMATAWRKALAEAPGPCRARAAPPP